MIQFIITAFKRAFGAHSKEELQRREDELRLSYALLKMDLTKQKQETTAAHVNRWRTKVGDAVDSMLKAPSIAIVEAESGDARKQEVAIGILTYHWRLSGTEEIIQLLQRVIKASEHETVREAAIYSAAVGLKATNRPYWLNFFAKIAESESESMQIRKSATVALYSIAGKPLPFAYDQKSIGTFFPEQVDWHFVRNCSRKSQVD